MVCPYCGEEMETGSIRSRDELFWHPGTKKNFFGLGDRGKSYRGAVILSKFNPWKGSRVTAYLCRDCDKVIINCSTIASLPYK